MTLRLFDPETRRRWSTGWNRSRVRQRTDASNRPGWDPSGSGKTSVRAAYGIPTTTRSRIGVGGPLQAPLSALLGSGPSVVCTNQFYRSLERAESFVWQTPFPQPTTVLTLRTECVRRKFRRTGISRIQLRTRAHAYLLDVPLYSQQGDAPAAYD